MVFPQFIISLNHSLVSLFVFTEHRNWKLLSTRSFKYAELYRICCWYLQYRSDVVYYGDPKSALSQSRQKWWILSVNNQKFCTWLLESTFKAKPKKDFRDQWLSEGVNIPDVTVWSNQKAFNFRNPWTSLGSRRNTIRRRSKARVYVREIYQF